MALAGSVEASACGGDIRAWSVGVDRGTAARRERQPAVWLATPFSGSARVPGVELLPIEIGPESVAPVAQPLAGSIEIALSGGVRVKIMGAVDPAAVTAAVAAVMKARRRR